MLKRARKKRGPNLRAAGELELYADNTGELYPEKQQIARILVSQKNRGAYSPVSAASMWRAWLKRAALRYPREIGDPVALGYGAFDPATLDHLASEYERYFRNRLHEV